MFRFSWLIPIVFTVLAAGALQAQDRSGPTFPAPVADIPVAEDRAFPGTMRLRVDASDTSQRLWIVKQTIPVSGSAPLTLLFPEWLPGNHAPRGQLEKMTGLRITALGQPVVWQRHPLDVFAIVVAVPAGATEIELDFQAANPTAENQGRVVVTDKLLNLQFERVSFYPAGYYVRRIPVQASVTYPAGWQAFSALRGSQEGAVVNYETTDYETLIDSPVFAGQYSATADLGEGVTLAMVADDPKELVHSDEQLAIHRKLVSEAVALFDSRHYDHYDFLLAITSELGGIGLEHHRSSENSVEPGYFTRWEDGPGDRNLLPHEFTHSWNGKFRRPAGLWTPDYRTPMQDELLWVYEGQTQFWGYVLGARAGLFSKQQTLDALASIAARLDLAKGRQWRPLVDTTFDPIIAARRPKAWNSWQRAEDYYNEGLLLWLEADGILRRESNGARGLDDFAAAFFGVRDGDYGQLLYTRDDVIAALQNVQPYDWTGFFAARVDQTSTEAPKSGLELGGYRLVYRDTPSSISKSIEGDLKGVDQSYGIGLVVTNEGNVQTVVWDSPAFAADLAVGMQIVAINGVQFSADTFRTALEQSGSSGAALDLIVRQGKNYRTISIEYRDGLRYPHLEKSTDGEGSLDLLLAPRT
jgi:predicted metalloprotease with PDZ domain